MINRTDPVSGVIEKAPVDKIMAKRMNPRKRENEYLVKWEGKPQTWEPASHLDTCKDLIDNFEVLLAKQKEMRAKSQLQQQQQQQVVVTTAQSAPLQTSTPVASTPNRPERSSKQKAINQVKQWTGGNKHHEEVAEVTGAGAKRKIEEFDEFDEEIDGDDVDDEDYELESSWEKKKMAQQLGQTSVKKIKTEIAGQNGAVRVVKTSGQDMQIGATVVRKVIGSKSPDVIIAGQKQMSGVFKKASPSAVITKKPGEGQVRIVEKKDQIQSGIVRVNQANVTSSPTVTKSTVVTRVVPKSSPGVTQVATKSSSGTVVRTVQSVQNQQKALAQKIIQRSPMNKAQTPVTTPQQQQRTQVVQKQQTPAQASSVVRRNPAQVVRKSTGPVTQRIIKKTQVNEEEDDDGIQDPFPKDLPPIEQETESPPPLTLCPITGKVLGQPESEVEQTEEQDADQHQITQILTNEDGTPIFITGEDGTMYQVAGKNAKGETILVSTNADGEQTCVLLPADQDLLANVPGIQTSDVTEAVQQTEESEATEHHEGGESTEETTTTQPLSIAVEGGDSQDGQITAEIVQADEPSPGKITKSILFYYDVRLLTHFITLILRRYKKSRFDAARWKSYGHRTIIGAISIIKYPAVV